MASRRPAAAWTPGRLEWIMAALAFVLYSGAIFPLLMEVGDGMIDDRERGLIRLTFLPVYAWALFAIARRPGPFVLVLRRNLPLAVLSLMTIASLLWSASGSITFRRSVALLLSMALAFLLAQFPPRRLLLLLACVLGGLTAASLVMAAILPGLAYSPGDSALRGLFVHKNVFGWVSSFVVITSLALCRDRTRRIRRLGWGLLAVGGAGLVLSTSATGLIAAMTAVLAHAALWLIEGQRGAAQLVAKLLALVLAVALAVLLVVGMVPLLDALGKDATLTGRVPLWRLVDPEIARSPLFGHGYGLFWSEANPAAWRIWDLSGWKAPHAHNGYRDLLLALGAVGLSLFAIVTFRALAQGLALCIAAPGTGWTWTVVAISASLTMNLTESTILMQNDLMWLIFVLAVLSISQGHAQLRTRMPRTLLLRLSAV